VGANLKKKGREKKSSVNTQGKDITLPSDAGRGVMTFEVPSILVKERDFPFKPSVQLGTARRWGKRHARELLKNSQTTTTRKKKEKKKNKKKKNQQQKKKKKKRVWRHSLEGERPSILRNSFARRGCSGKKNYRFISTISPLEKGGGPSCTSEVTLRKKMCWGIQLSIDWF